MRPTGPFVAERVAAQHCPELLRGTRQAADPLKELARLGQRLPELLELHFGTLCAGARAEVRVGEPVEMQAGAVSDKRGDQVLNGSIAIGPKEVMMIASLPRRAVLGLVDLALGGTGKDCQLSTGRLPMSAQMMFGRFEKMISGVLAQAMGIADPETVRPKPSASGIDMGTPFAGCRRTILPLEVTIGDNQPWEIALVFPGSSVAALVANQPETRATKMASDGAERDPAGASPNAEPFGGIPLPVRAILVDMAVPVSTLSRLKPGMVIPVAVARSVPLVAGDQVIAHGTVGAMDDRAALQLTRTTSSKEK